jgi:hypothetical protein
LLEFGEFPQGATTIDMKRHFGWVQEGTALKYIDETKDRARKMAKMLTVGSVALPLSSPPSHPLPPPPSPPPPPPPPPHLPAAAGSAGSGWAVVSPGSLPLGATVIASAHDTTITSSQFQALRTISSGQEEVIQEQVLRTIQVTGAKEEPSKVYNISVGNSSNVTLNFQ